MKNPPIRSAGRVGLFLVVLVFIIFDEGPLSVVGLQALGPLSLRFFATARCASFSSALFWRGLLGNDGGKGWRRSERWSWRACSFGMEAGATENGSIAPWLERNLGWLAATSAGGWIHLSGFEGPRSWGDAWSRELTRLDGRVHLGATYRTTLRTAAWGISEPAALVEFLFTLGKGKADSTLSADEGLVHQRTVTPCN